MCFVLFGDSNDSWYIRKNVFHPPTKDGVKGCLKSGALSCHKWIFPDDGGGGGHRNMSDFMNTFQYF